MSCKNKNHDEIKRKILSVAEFSDSVDRLSNIFLMLGDSSRMKIVLALLEGELCVFHICEITGAKQSATSQHLRKLKDSGIVKCRKEGNLSVYSLADEHIVSIVNLAIKHKDCNFNL